MATPKPQNTKPTREIVATVELSKPIYVHGKPVQALEFRDATLGDLKGLSIKKMAEGEIDDLLVLVSRLAHIPASETEAISTHDLNPIQEVLLPLLGLSDDSAEDEETQTEAEAGSDTL